LVNYNSIYNIDNISKIYKILVFKNKKIIIKYIMIKISYKNPDESESPDDICKYNMILSDNYKNLQAFSQSSLAWLKNDSTRNYQDLEKLLRELNLDTHLIARPLDNNILNDITKLFIPNRTDQPKNLEYMLLVSCRSKEEALKELSLYHLSYEDNFECLYKTGSYNSTEDLQKNFSYNSDNNPKENLILDSKLKYDFIRVNGKESINVIIQDLISKYNKEPEKTVCGKLGEEDIYSLTLDGQISSPIGWIEKDDDYQLIDFRMIKKV